MRVTIDIGVNYEFVLTSALLIYEDQHRKGDKFATVHKIVREGSACEPRLAPGTLLTKEFLAELSRGLEQESAAVLLPENVLARSSDYLLWWTPNRFHPMFFSEGAEDRALLDGRTFPHPPMVWKVRRGNLWLRALPCVGRPNADTVLMTAPYWNTEPVGGHVCLGSMQRPARTDIPQMTEWEEGFYNSQFTHPSGMGKLTSHRGGFIGLWTEHAGASEFAMRYLVPSGQTLRQFAEA